MLARNYLHMIDRVLGEFMIIVNSALNNGQSLYNHIAMGTKRWAYNETMYKSPQAKDVYVVPTLV